LVQLSTDSLFSERRKQYVRNQGVQRTPTYFESALCLLGKQYVESNSKNKYNILSLLGQDTQSQSRLLNLYTLMQPNCLFLTALMWFLFGKAVLTSIWNYYERILLLLCVLEYDLLATLWSRWCSGKGHNDAGIGNSNNGC